MEIENINEWIYYYHNKDEEALPTLIEYFHPMVISLYNLMASSNEYVNIEKDEFDSIAHVTLVTCLENYRYFSSSPFYIYYYVCLKRKFIDALRLTMHGSFPSYVACISLDAKVYKDDTDNRLYYRDIVYNPYTIQEEAFVLGKCQKDYLLNCAQNEMSEMDYEILKLRHEGYTVQFIAEKFGVSKQVVYYRIKKIRNWFTSH